MKNKKITFGIIGYGRFGKLWAKYMSKFGTVSVYDNKKINFEKNENVIQSDLKQAVSANIIFLTVPISELEKCCNIINPLLSRDTLVVDVCSVKMWSVAVMKKCLPKKQPMLSTHPLFGPDSEKINNGINGLKIVVCPTKEKNVFKDELMDIFRELNLNIILASPKDHDKQMANSQALVHLIGRGLAKLKLDHQEISTPDYNSLVRINQMVNNDTWKLFFDMQSKNPFASVVREKFIENLEDLSEIISMKNNTLVDFRDGIKNIDNNIIKLLSLRFEIAKKIGVFKKVNNLKVIDRDRERKLVKLHHAYSKQNKVDRELVDKIFAQVIKHSVAIQNKIVK